MTYWIAAAVACAWVEVGRNCHGFYHGIAKDSVGIRFHLDNCGWTDQGGSLYTFQDHLLWTATSRVVYIEDSLSAWSVEEDCVWQRDIVYFKVLGEVAWNLGYPIIGGELSFEVGDFVYLKVSPMRGFRCFKFRGKLTPRFIGPFKILEKRGEVAYQLELPP
jgi:hypothetical protein